MFEFKFPDVGEGIHEGKIVDWLVAVGDRVTVDQPFVRVETDKAVVDLPAPRAAVVLALLFERGATIHVGDVIATFGEEGEKGAAVPAPPAPAVPAPPPRPAEAGPTASPAPRKTLATPHTRAYARKMGVDLATVIPTGKGGRITDEDVDSAARAPAAPAAPPQVRPASASGPAGPPEGPIEITPQGPVERQPISHLRKVIADAMVLSKRTSAHVTHLDEADVTDLAALYRQVKPMVEVDGATKFSLTAFFVKAVVAVLKEHPILNASFDEAKGELVFRKYYNIGVAVDTPEGLIVPVLKDADKKDMLRVAREIADLAKRARERRLSLEELKGATFTVTNVGAIGGLAATPIIHQPELAIAAFFAVKEKPAVYQGAVVPRRIMNVAITFDHRFIDGAEGARATAALVRLLENPGLLMVHL